MRRPKNSITSKQVGNSFQFLWLFQKTFINVSKKVKEKYYFYEKWLGSKRTIISIVINISNSILTAQFPFRNCLEYKLIGTGILLPKLFWPTVRKNCSTDWEKVLKFEVEHQEFAKICNNLFKQWKVKTTFGNRMLF